MKIVKKLTVGLVGIIVVVLAITYIPTKYEENQNKTDQYIALECAGMIMAANSTKMQYQAPTKYFILESSKKSRSEDNYYKKAIGIEAEFEWFPVEEPLPILDYFVQGEYTVIRTAKYIHLFKFLVDALEFIDQQEKLPMHKDALEEGKPVLTTMSFDRETLERVYWGFLEEKLNRQQCKEVSVDVPYNLVKKTEERAMSGNKIL
mgnify:CR=1 FL=1